MDITKIWAKTAPKKSLIDHMLETGIVTECLIDADGMYRPDFFIGLYWCEKR